MSNLKFKISDKATLAEALEKIELNKTGAVLIVSDEDIVKGLITDGDARRFILSGQSTSESVIKCYNPKFTYVDDGCSREKILKLLDEQVNFLPVLDSEKKLKQVYTRKDFPIEQEKNTIARSRAPVRISFGGGGTDLTYFFSGSGGAVINATIKMYAHCELHKREDSQIIVNSYDLNKTAKVSSVEELAKISEFELIASLIKLISPSYGFELSIHCDFPVGSGLGGSSAVLASILGCFNQFRNDPWDLYEIAELAFQAERLYSGVKGGWQDQYATVFGGFNFIEFSAEENIVHPLRINTNILWELEENLFLCGTGSGRSSGDVHKDQEKKVGSDKDAAQSAAKNKDMTYKIRSHLLRGNLKEFGRMLHEGWQLKRQLSDKISNPKLDEIYEVALKHGAAGGKLLGAGGGGYYLFYAEGQDKIRLQRKFQEMGLVTKNISFELEGVQSWKVRKK